METKYWIRNFLAEFFVITLIYALILPLCKVAWDVALFAGVVMGFLVATIVSVVYVLLLRSIKSPNGALDWTPTSRIHAGAAGGKIFFLQDAMIFKPYGLNYHHKSVIIPYADIKSYGKYGSVDGIKIRMKDGSEEVFVISPQGKFKKRMAVIFA